jgi:hypothetical protein
MGNILTRVLTPFNSTAAYALRASSSERRPPALRESPPERRPPESPSERRLPPLPPYVHVEKTKTIKQLCLQENRETPPKFEELRLNRKPESLKEYTELFMLANGKFNTNRVIWTTTESFVCLRTFKPRNLPEPYKNFQLAIELGDSGVENDFCLRIYSSTLEEATACLDFLAGLNDSHFKFMGVNYYDAPRSEVGGTLVSPFSNSLLEKIILQNALRLNAFHDIVFTPDNCIILATCGRRTKLKLVRCFFDDEGDAFVEASVSREDEDTGPVKLTICFNLPCDEDNWNFYMEYTTLESLTLYLVDFNTMESCRVLAAAEIQYLCLSVCWLQDGGAALIESLRIGCGPKGLCIATGDVDDSFPFHSFQMLITFLDELRGNTYLERFELWNGHSCHGIPQALAAALHENEGLTRLGLHGCKLDERSWYKLLRSISVHPSLQRLRFNHISSQGMPAIRDRTKSLADMLSVNKQVEEILYDGISFDLAYWDRNVAPRLDDNFYRPLLRAIQEMPEVSSRAAVLPQILAHVGSKPSLVWSLLSRNLDLSSTYMDATVTRDDLISSPLPRRRPKRHRFPSSDA